eukprot:g81354.t1
MPLHEACAKKVSGDHNKPEVGMSVFHMHDMIILHKQKDKHDQCVSSADNLAIHFRIDQVDVHFKCHPTRRKYATDTCWKIQIQTSRNVQFCLE